jgi:hypothetical protein
LLRVFETKIGYIGHCRFLLEVHLYRRSEFFNGNVLNGDPPRKYTPDEVAQKVEIAKDYKPCKNPSCKKQKCTITGEPT